MAANALVIQSSKSDLIWFVWLRSYREFNWSFPKNICQILLLLCGNHLIIMDSADKWFFLIVCPASQISSDFAGHFLFLIISFSDIFAICPECPPCPFIFVIQYNRKNTVWGDGHRANIQPVWSPRPSGIFVRFKQSNSADLQNRADDTRRRGFLLWPCADFRAAQCRALARAVQIRRLLSRRCVYNTRHRRGLLIRSRWYRGNAGAHYPRWNCGARGAVAQLVEQGKAHPVSAVQVRPAVFKRRHMSGYGHGKKSVFILVQPTAGGFDPRCRLPIDPRCTWTAGVVLSNVESGCCLAQQPQHGNAPRQDDVNTRQVQVWKVPQRIRGIQLYSDSNIVEEVRWLSHLLKSPAGAGPAVPTKPYAAKNRVSTAAVP